MRPVQRAAAAAAMVGLAVLSGGGIAAAIPNPEPVGPGQIRVVGLGDSVMSAEGCDCASFLQTTGDMLGSARKKEPVVNNEAAAGYSTSEILLSLQDPRVVAEIADADLIVIEAGANDFSADDAFDDACVADAAGCYGDELQTAQDNLGAIVDAVAQLAHKPQMQIVLVGYWSIFEDGEVASTYGDGFVAYTSTVTAAFNDAVVQVATQRAVKYADVVLPFKGVAGTNDDTWMLQEDGDHPAAPGQEALAIAVVKALGADALQ